MVGRARPCCTFPYYVRSRVHFHSLRRESWSSPFAFSPYPPAFVPYGNSTFTNPSIPLTLVAQSPSRCRVTTIMYPSPPLLLIPPHLTPASYPTTRPDSPPSSAFFSPRPNDEHDMQPNPDAQRHFGSSTSFRQQTGGTVNPQSSLAPRRL